jgi:hypothetical protein
LDLNFSIPADSLAIYKLQPEIMCLLLILSNVVLFQSNYRSHRDNEKIPYQFGWSECWVVEMSAKMKVLLDRKIVAEIQIG